METTHYSKRFLTALVVADLSVLLFFVWYSGYIGGLQRSVSITQVAPPQILSSSSSVSGRITNIASTTLTILTPDSTPVTRTVLINPSTIFGFKVLKDQKTFQNDLLAFNAQLKAAGVKDTPFITGRPTPFTIKALSLADLEKGDMVTITATGPILSRSEFTAMNVIVESRSSQ